MKKILLLFALMAGTFTTIKAQYKVGDIYDNDGVKGLVVNVADGGKHGMVMSLVGCAKSWLSDSDSKFETGAFYEDDGMKNMEAVEKFIKENGKSWEDFPLFEWAKNLGEGWYIPARDELVEIVKSINGGSMNYNQKAMKDFDKKLKKAKGKTMIDGGMAGTNDFYRLYSSTECEGGMVYTLWMKEKTGSALKGLAFGKASAKKGTLEIIPFSKKAFGGKMGGSYSRAVHKF